MRIQPIRTSLPRPAPICLQHHPQGRACACLTRRQASSTPSPAGLASFAEMKVRRHDHDSMDMSGTDMGGMDMGSSVAGVPSLDLLMQYYWAVVGSFVGIAALVNVANILICRQRSVPMSNESPPRVVLMQHIQTFCCSPRPHETGQA